MRNGGMSMVPTTSLLGKTSSPWAIAWQGLKAVTVIMIAPTKLKIVRFRLSIMVVAS
jgi:hypothetical protein